MALVHSYATVEQLRTHMGDEGNAAPEAMLERALNSASRQIEGFCGRRFWKDTAVTVRLYRPEEPDIVWVDDIASTSGLIVQTDENDDGTFERTWTLDTDFELQPDNADSVGATQGYGWWILAAIGDLLFPVTTRRRKPLKVTALHGWSAVPAAIEEATLMRAYTLYHRHLSPHGVTGLAEFGPVRTSRMDYDLLALLGPYSRVHIGSV